MDIQYYFGIYLRVKHKSVIIMVIILSGIILDYDDNVYLDYWKIIVTFAS